jgi:hypothetical protein
MKRIRSVSVFAALLMMVVGLAHAEDKKAPAPKGGDIAAKLEANERMINDAVKGKDAKMFMDMVDKDGWSADMTGFQPVSAMPEMIKDIDVKSYTIDNVKVLMIDRDAYIVTYNWTGEAMYKGQPYPPGPFYCATVWKKKGDDWKAVYHQETMAMQPPPAAAPTSH